ncbi:putative oxidoreductase YteT isoform X2 [Antedon mediterranea]
MSEVEAEETKIITAVIVGAGNRGQMYAEFSRIHPERFKVVAVADPKKFARTYIQKRYKLTDERVFEDFNDILKLEKLADCVVIATPDALHKEPAVGFANAGYHILLEKPMAVTEEDCREIVAACKKNNTILSVGHVLRYYPPLQKLKELINSGIIGDVVNIHLHEPVGFYHFAHSYVRGNWRNEDESTFVLMAKCCHDIDLLLWWFEGQRCTKVSSFGSLFQFRKEKKPEGASSRCMDCSVEKECPYSAKKMYLDPIKEGCVGWSSVICDEPSIESVTDALRNGPYGRCVYESDNDVCDNQVVNFEFENGQTATFSMVAFTEKLCERQVKVFGTMGELTFNGSGPISRFDFNSKEIFIHKPVCSFSGFGGHGGADYHLINSFVHALAENDPSKVVTGADISLRSHLLVFRAEQARVEGRVVVPEDVLV